MPAPPNFTKDAMHYLNEKWKGFSTRSMSNTETTISGQKKTWQSTKVAGKLTSNTKSPRTLVLKEEPKIFA